MITFSIVSDLYLAGHTEDGAEYTAEVFYIQAEDDRGRRWNHPSSFPGCRTVADPESDYIGFEDIREDAKARAERLMVRCKNYHESFGIDFDRKWHAAPTAYGSPAYGLEDEWDRMDDEERAAYFRA